MDGAGEIGQPGLARAEIDVLLVAMSPADWKRAERLAAFAARGLTGRTGEDLLQETLEQLLDGRRRFPREVHPLVALKTAMRSNASNARKLARGSPIRDDIPVVGHASELVITRAVDGEDRRTPAIALDAQATLDAIANELAGDIVASQVVLAWADGLRGAEAAAAAGLAAKDYDAARKRLLRKLAAHDADRSGS